jgi:adenosylmethionine-8-amino-7-oxononanoate aminotransferase
MATPTKTWNTAELKEKGKAHLLNSVSNLKQVREHGPLVIGRGEGVYLWDTDGKRYIDAFAGLWNVNIGHGRTELGEAMARQVEEVAFVPTFFGLAAPSAIELAARLGGMFPGTINHFNFTSGGSESIETALKIARYYWFLQGRADKVKILSRNMAYHGIAMGALAATGIPAYHQGFGPMTPGFIHLTAPYAYRNGEGLSEEQFVDKLVEELEQTIAREGADTIAAMIGEPVQGAGGVVPPPASYWPRMIEVLNKHDILLIADEVICGFGRTGTMFGHVTYGYEPDIAAFAKGITSGYVPLGGVGVTDQIWDVLSEPDRVFMHGFTYSGHPVACAAALVNLDIIENERLPENAGMMGPRLLDGLTAALGDHPNVGEIRGKGLMVIIEMVADRETKAKFDPAINISGKLTAATRERGLIVRASNDGIAFAPPLSISADEVDTVIATTADAVRAVLG